MKIKRNKVKCNRCGDIIESRYTHNYVICSCGAVAADGGLEYLRRCYMNEDDFTELSEWGVDEETLD